MRLLALGGATAVFLWLFLRQADLGKAFSEIAKLPAWTVLASIGAVAVNLGFMALRWRLLFKAAGYRVDTGRLFAIICAGIGVNNVLPLRAGDLVRIEAVRREDHVPGFVVVGTLFAERLLDGIVLSVFILTGALIIGDTGPLLLTGIALSAGCALGVGLVALAAARPSRTMRAVQALARHLPGRWRDRVERAGMNVISGLAAFKARRTLVLVIAVSGLVWLADLALYIAVGAGFGLDVGVGGYLALEGVGNLALGVPATAAGVGSFDYLTLTTAQSLGIPAATATAYTLVVHALVIIPVTVVGLFFLFRVLPGKRGFLVEKTA